MRSGPGINYSQIGTVSTGTNVPVIARDPGANWLLVQDNGKTGWVAAWLVTIRGDLNNLPIQP
jgi:uncharacterized protein YgiM (DUF1202 family)